MTDAAVPPIPVVLAERLRGSQPVQRRFGWHRGKWEPVVADLPEASAACGRLPDELGRREVREVVQRELEGGNALAAFVPVLIWGGPGGYGPFRARKILTGEPSGKCWDMPVDESVATKLLEGARVVREGAPVDAFRLMNNAGHVKYLGGSFFTKWLCFASARTSVDGPEVAPILDKRVRDWVAKHTREVGAVQLSTVRTQDYERYLQLLDAWREGPDWSRTRAQVELAIFDLSRDRPPAEE